MSGFTSIAYYAPSLVLLAGAFTISGLLGIGNEVGGALRLEQPWRSAVGAIAASEMFTLGVEGLAIAQIATRTILVVVWAVFCACGSFLLLRRRPFAWVPTNWMIAIPAAILGINLLIALCPSTKGDEVYYHMIVPSRIVQDGGLVFYREPMRSAIYPQMAFQIGFAPFHALALPDGGNVVSWFFGALLIWFTYTLIRMKSGSTAWAAVFGAATVAGLYTSVWHVTSGAHAIGDLAVACAVVALYLIDDLAAAAGRQHVAISVGILAAAAASTKVLLFPFALAIVLIAAVRMGWRSLSLLILPALLFIGPLMLWTAVHSGSPLGPLLEGITGRSAYLPYEARAFVDEYVAGPRGPILQKLRNEAVNYSPILWLSVAAFVLARRHVAAKPALGVALLILQVVIIIGWNTYDARYLGGVQYALMIVFAVSLNPSLRDRIVADRRFLPVAAALLAPWMLLQIVYAGQFLKLPAHLESKSDFYERYVPFFSDFVALDHQLPNDAVLLSLPYALDSIYAPRPIYYHVLDVPAHRPAFLLSYSEDSSDLAPDLHLRFTIGEKIYENDHSAIATYRFPGKKPLLGTLRVRRLR